jgi:hypothetical protein
MQPAILRFAEIDETGFAGRAFLPGCLATLQGKADHGICFAQAVGKMLIMVRQGQNLLAQRAVELPQIGHAARRRPVGLGKHHVEADGGNIRRSQAVDQTRPDEFLGHGH